MRTLAGLAVLVAACGDNAVPTVDGPIDYDSEFFIDGHSHNTVHVEPDGSAVRTDVVRVQSVAFMLTDAQRSTLYQQASDADLEDAPAEYPCPAPGTSQGGCYSGYHFTVTVTIGGQTYRTETHSDSELDVPAPLAATVELLDQLTRPPLPTSEDRP